MYPPGVVTRTCTVGGSAAVESGTDLVISVSIEASRGLIRDGERMPSSPEVKTSIAGGEVSFDLPVSDQSGYRDEATGAVIDVSAPDSHTHTYTATITTTRGSKLVSQRVVNFPLPTGDLSPVDVDTLIDAGTVDGVLVSVPDSWSARLDALEAGGGGSATRGLIVTAVDVPTIPAGDTTDNLAAYYNSAAVPITVAGVELAAGRHAVWAWVAGAWTLLSSGASTPPVDPSDTTAPVWSATLTTGIPTDTAVVIAASALATDDVAVTGYRWRLTGEGVGVARTVTPSGLNFTLDGLTASTSYAAPILWAVDAGGNKSAELTAQTFTTDTVPPGWVTIFHDTFTDTDGTLLPNHTVDYTANVGWTRADNRPLYNTIHSNQYRPAAHPDYGFSDARAGTDIVVSGKKLRVSGSYGATAPSLTFGPGIWLNNAPQFTFGVNITTGAPTTASAYNVDLVPTSVSPTNVPMSGNWVWEVSETNMTLHINGVLFGEWEITSYQGRNFTQVFIGGGANDLYNGLAPGTLSGGYVDDVRIETWQ